MTQYDFFFELATDERFLQRVGNIFTEIGASNYQKRLNRYLGAADSGNPQSRAELNDIYRDFYDAGIWDMTNLYQFLQKIHDVNAALDSSNRIHVYPSGKAFSYDGMNKERYEQYDAPNNDSSIAANIIQKFLEIKNSDREAKALVIMNFRHAFNRHLRRPDSSLARNVGGYLYDAFPGEVANVMLNTVVSRVSGDTVNFSAIQAGRWDAAFAAIRDRPVGFDLAQSPFGGDHCDYWHSWDHTLTYQDLFTGFVFYNRVQDHILCFGVPAIFDGTFDDTLKERIEELFDVDSAFSAQYIHFVKERHELTYSTMDRHFDFNCSNSVVEQQISNWID
jgi:hypothetical protein